MDNDELLMAGTDNDAEAYRAIQLMDIEALIDNELTPARRKVVMAALEDDPALKQKYEQLQKQKQMLSAWWQSTPKS